MVCLLLSPILFPFLMGLYLLIRKEMRERKELLILTGAILVITAVLAILSICLASGQELVLFYMTEALPIVFRLDEMGVLFTLLTVIIFLCAGFFAFEYMKHEEKEKRYFGYYVMTFGVLLALCFAGNMITFYLFFEMLTLLSMPLVLHNGSKEAIMAALKYLFYSMCGAYLALFGVYFAQKYGATLAFAGVNIGTELAKGQEGILLLSAFLMILGFSVKAGMFPLHAWLPAAHPVAPAPASAVLSAMIAKAGVLGIIRVMYYLFDPAFLAGTWVQYAFMILTLITVFMGSMLAYREPVIKKRFAYSTVSQISYILFGLSVMNMTSVTGGVLHVICHGFIKTTLFLCAGAIIYQTGKTRVEELRGMGKAMPLLMWCYTIVSLGLIGIPPTGGFVSKWYLAMGALGMGDGISRPVIAYLGIAVLLLSALLTAGYLLPITVQGFFPGADYDYDALQKKEPAKMMLIPILILTVLSVLVGLFPNPVTEFIRNAINYIFV